MKENLVRVIAHLKNEGETAAQTDIVITVLSVKNFFKIVCSIGKGSSRNETILDCPDLAVCRKVLATLLQPFEPFKKRIFWPSEELSYMDFVTQKYLK